MLQNNDEKKTSSRCMFRCHANFMRVDFKLHANFIHISCTCFHTPSGSFPVNFTHLFSHPFWDPFTQISRTWTLLIDRETIIFVLCRLRGLQIPLVFHSASPGRRHDICMQVLPGAPLEVENDPAANSLKNAQHSVVFGY